MKTPRSKHSAVKDSPSAMATAPGASPAAPVPVPSLLNLAAQVTAAALALGHPRVVAEIAELPRDLAEYVANIFFKTKLDAADVAAGGSGGGGRLSGGGGSRGSRGRGSSRGSGGGANWPAGTVGGGRGGGGFLGGGNGGLDGDAGGRGGNGGGGGGAAKHLPALRALAEHAALSPAALTLSDRTLSRAGLGGAVQVDSRHLTPVLKLELAPVQLLCARLFPNQNPASSSAFSCDVRPYTWGTCTWPRTP